MTVGAALTAFPAATAVTRFRFRFRFRTTLSIMFPVARTMPVEAPTIPFSFLMPDFGRLNTPGSPILPLVAFSPPFAIWMPRGYGKAVPEALEGAGYIDGASRARFLRQMLFPLVIPASTESPIPVLLFLVLVVLVVLVQRRLVSGLGGAVKD